MIGLALALGGCADEGPVAVVRLQARPAVGTVTSVEVALDNDNATQRETFAVTGKRFPLTFSVQTPGRSGTLAIHAEARDGTGELRAVGDATVELDPAGRVDTDLMLEPQDFVVNTTFVGSQDLAFRFDGGGRQLSAAPDGRFTIGWSDTCQMVGRCDVFGRRFDAGGAAVDTVIAAGATQFNFNQRDGFTGYEPSLATDRSGNTLAAWATGGELFAVVIDAAGSPLAALETQVTTGTSPGTPAAIALPDGRFIVAWCDTIGSTQHIRARYLSSTGQPINNPVTNTNLAFQVSTTALAIDSPPAMVSLGGGSFAIAWQDGPDIRGRFYGTTGQPTSATDLVLATHTDQDDVMPPQLGTLGGDALLLYARFTFGGGGADNGELLLRRVSAQGTTIGTPTVVADDVQFGPASITSLDGATGVAWSACNTLADAAGCGIWFRAFDVNLAPVSAPIAVNTTTAGDQEDPSVAWLPDGAAAVAWSDGSMAAPDRDAGAVRARIIYPPRP